MREGPVVFQMRLPVEETENEVSVREDSHGQTRNRSPLSHLFIMYGLGYDGARYRMSYTVH